MQVTVFVERLDEQTYRAETAQPAVLVTEGRTRDEAAVAGVGSASPDCRRNGASGPF
jgi:hypothetical protein